MTAVKLLRLEQVIAETAVAQSELVYWIEQRWILPQEKAGEYLFDDMDCARVRLIADLRGMMAVNEEAMPVVLQLLDQVYALRQVLQDVEAALEALPPDVQATVRAKLRQATEL